MVEVEKRSGKPAKYNLDLDGLEAQVRSVRHLPVAIIPIVGTSRQGKSFLLNYMMRYLSNPSDPKWIGDRDQALTGISVYFKYHTLIMLLHII